MPPIPQTVKEPPAGSYGIIFPATCAPEKYLDPRHTGAKPGVSRLSRVSRGYGYPLEACQNFFDTLGDGRQCRPSPSCAQEDFLMQ